MKTKFCPFCGKELPEEMTFCLYCMNKLAPEEQIYNTIVHKKSKAPIIITAVVIIIIISGLICFFLFSKILGRNDKQTFSDIETNTVTETDSEIETDIKANTKTNETEIDLTEYKGIWRDKDDDTLTLNITAVDKNIIYLDLSRVYGTDNNPRYVGIENVVATVEENKAEFSFGNDGWGNQGIGSLTFYDGKVNVYTSLTVKEESAPIGLEVNATLTEHKFVGIILDSYLTRDYSEIINALSKQTSSPIYGEMGDIYYTHGEVSVCVDEQQGYIRQIDIDYTNAEDKTKYSISFVDGTYTYEQVKKQMGEPYSGGTDDLGYYYKQGFIRFYFDENKTIKEISYFLPM